MLNYAGLIKLIILFIFILVFIFLIFCLGPFSCLLIVAVASTSTGTEFSTWHTGIMASTSYRLARHASLTGTFDHFEDVIRNKTDIIRNSCWCQGNGSMELSPSMFKWINIWWVGDLGSKAFLHTATCRCARSTFSRKASSVGGRV